MKTGALIVLVICIAFGICAYMVKTGLDRQYNTEHQSVFTPRPYPSLTPCSSTTPTVEPGVSAYVGCQP